MGRYVIRRLLQMIPVILGITFIIYVSVFALGDPTVGRCGERPCPDGYIAKFRADNNLDKPLLLQYVLYLGNLVRGDLGTNFYGNSVAEELAARLPTTIKLAVMAISIEAVIGIGAGVLAGIRRGKFIDSLVTVSTLVLISIPHLRDRRLRPADLRHQASAGSRSPPPRARSTQLIMPAFVLASVSVAYVARLMRTNLAENLRADYVRTGQGERAVAEPGRRGAHPAQLADPGDHLHRHRHRRTDGRCGRHRADLQHQRRRQLPVSQHHQQGRDVGGRHHHSAWC